MSELSDQERASFKRVESPQQMIDSIQGHIAQLGTKDESRLLNCCGRIHRLGRALKPYFQIIELLVSSNPEFAAIAWGALSLVFQVRARQVVDFVRIN